MKHRNGTTKTTEKKEEAYLRMNAIDNWQFSVIYLILFDCFFFIVVFFSFTQLSFNNQLMQSVRDHLIVLNWARAREREKKRKWWGIRKCINPMNWHSETMSSWESIAPIQQLSRIGLPKKRCSIKKMEPDLIIMSKFFLSLIEFIL